MKILGREPAAILYTLQAVLAALVAFGVLGLTEESGAWVLTIANGVLALVVALATRPFVISALTGAVQTILTGLISFGLPLTMAEMGAAITALSVVVALILRPNVEPRETAITHA